MLIKILVQLLMVWSFCHSAGLLPTDSEDCEEACGGVSHMVLSDILVPVLDETVESSLHKEAFSAGLNKDAVRVSLFILTDHWLLK